PARSGRQAACPDDVIDGVFGHASVGGELAADDGQCPGPRIAQQGVLAGEIGAAGGSCARDQRAGARVAADDVLGCELVVEDGVDCAQQEHLLVVVGVGAFGDRTTVRIVGEADYDQTVVPRHSEDVAAEVTGHRCGDRGLRAAQASGRHEDVRPLARSEFDVVGERVGPDAGGGDDLTGAQRVLVPGEAVDEVNAAGFDVGDLGVGDDAGTVNGGRAGQGDDEPGVVDELTVPAEQSAAQTLAGRRRGEAADRGGRDSTGAGEEILRGVCEPAQDVTGVEAGARDGGLDAADPRVKWEDHRQGADEMWGDGVHQPAALDGGFPRDRHVGPGEVAQSAVGELGTPTARARGEVAAFDEGDGQTAGSGVEGDADAGEAAADDDDVGVTGSRC